MVPMQRVLKYHLLLQVPESGLWGAGAGWLRRWWAWRIHLPVSREGVPVGVAGTFLEGSLGPSFRASGGSGLGLFARPPGRTGQDRPG